MAQPRRHTERRGDRDQQRLLVAGLAVPVLDDPVLDDPVHLDLAGRSMPIGQRHQVHRRQRIGPGDQRHLARALAVALVLIKLG